MEIREHPPNILETQYTLILIGPIRPNLNHQLQLKQCILIIPGQFTEPIIGNQRLELKDRSNPYLATLGTDSNNPRKFEM